MSRRILNLFILALIPILFLSCNGGLDPTPPLIEPTGFSGKITFIGTWPDKIKRTHLVVFKNPILQGTDFFPPNLSIIIDSVAFGTNVFTYNSVDNNYKKDFQVQPGEYAYVVVVQSTKAELSLLRADWTVAGIYYSGTDSTIPGVLKIENNKMTKNINIICDFNNPPPQPPGGQ